MSGFYDSGQRDTLSADVLQMRFFLELLLHDLVGIAQHL
jgi:hypothetical protein